MFNAATIRVSSFLVLLLIIVCSVSLPAGADMRLLKGQTIYVPVYSHIYSGDREQPFYLAATLSIRNTDTSGAITITAVDYYDSKGKFLKHYLENALTVGALATQRYVVPESDKSGGSGAKFIIKWRSDQPVAEPLIESVMISTKTQQGISFTSRGRVLETITR
jgi:hypothetical protein